MATEKVDSRIPFPPHDWVINEAADFLRSFQKLQTAGGAPVDLTDYGAELWVKPDGGGEFVVSTNGSSAPHTSATITPLTGTITIFISEQAITDNGLEHGGLARFDLIDPDGRKLPQFKVVFVWDRKYEKRYA